MAFTRRAENRIAAAVRKVEGTPPAPARAPIGPAFYADEIFAVKLTEAMGATTSGEAAAVLMDFTASTEAYTASTTEIVCVDPLGIFADGESGASGFAFARGGNDRTVFILIQLECPA